MTTHKRTSDALEIFDRLFNESAVNSYHDFQQLVAEVGEEEAPAQGGT